MREGTLVRLKTDPSRSGTLTGRERWQQDRKMLEMGAPTGRVTWHFEDALEPSITAFTPISERIHQGQMTGPEELRKLVTRLRVGGNLSDVIYSMEATNTDFYAYQFKPVLKLLEAPTNAILIADEVGLGKTIEAILIWTELQTRANAHRLLVLCPKTLRTKWKREIEHRCGTDANIVERAEDLTALLRRGQRGSGYIAIGGFQALRPPKGWEDPSQHKKSGRAALARYLREEEENGRESLIDLLVIDEAHHLRNPETLLNELGSRFNAVSTYRVMLSATPIQLQSRDLYSLLHFIDPHTFDSLQTLDETLAANEPIIATRDALLNKEMDLGTIMSRIEEARMNALLKDNHALEAIAERLRYGEPSTETRAQLARQVEQANLLANYITRSRRRHVQELRVERVPKAPHFAMNADEQRFYDEISEASAAFAAERDTSPGLILSQAQRLASSSPAAASRYWCDITQGRPPATDLEDHDEDMDDETPEEGPLLRLMADTAMALDLSERLAKNDTKVAMLRNELEMIWAERAQTKVVLFSSFKITLRYLSEQLSRTGIQHEVLHGDSKEPADDILNRFREDPRKRLLLATRTGSEGIDLQFATVVINFDLPWNPMEVEQRIGRIDRLGQQASEICVLTLIHENTIERVIYERLYERIGLIQRALGDLETIIDSPLERFSRLTRSLVRTTNRETQSREIDQIAQAMRRLDEVDLKDEAGGLHRHGDYILQEINTKHDDQLWMSGEELCDYVKDTLHEHYPACRFERHTPGSDTYRIELTEAARLTLQEHMRVSKHGETTRLLRSSSSNRYRFAVRRIHGREDRIKVEDITRTHPLVRFAHTLERGTTRDERPLVYGARLEAQQVPTAVEPGLYIIGLRLWSTLGQTGRQTSAHLIQTAIRVSNQVRLSTTDTTKLVRAASVDGTPLVGFVGHTLGSRAATCWTEVVEPAMERECDEHEKAGKAKRADRADIQARALKRKSIARLERLTRLETEYRKIGSRMLKPIQGQIRAELERTEARRKEIEHARQMDQETREIGCVIVEVTPA